MKGQLHISVPNYTPEHKRGKPYRRPTYSIQADASRISIKNQAKEYALWLMKNGRESCHVYRMRKSGRGPSVEFRRYLQEFHRGPLQFIQVNPDDHLGKLTDRDVETVT